MIKRYTPGIEQSHPELEAVAFMMEANHGECVMHADHAALIAKVREGVENVKRAATKIDDVGVRGAVFFSLSELLEVCNG